MHISTFVNVYYNAYLVVKTHLFAYIGFFKCKFKRIFEWYSAHKVPVPGYINIIYIVVCTVLIHNSIIYIHTSYDYKKKNLSSLLV